jgi:uncharacterized protein YjgD (DUF1641 family)
MDAEIRDLLERRVEAAHAWRDDERARREVGERSIMRELLDPDEADRLEISPGRWLLQGPPP